MEGLGAEVGWSYGEAFWPCVGGFAAYEESLAVVVLKMWWGCRLTNGRHHKINSLSRRSPPRSLPPTHDVLPLQRIAPYKNSLVRTDVALYLDVIVEYTWCTEEERHGRAFACTYIPWLDRKILYRMVYGGREWTHGEV